MMQYFKSSADPLARLRSYLQMYVDIEDAFVYSQSMQFPVALPGKPHNHFRCMSSLSVKRDGTPLISADDLVNANRDCLNHRFLILFSGNENMSRGSTTTTEPMSLAPSKLLAVLDANARTDRPAHGTVECHDWNLDKWPEVWSNRELSYPMAAEPGDYGFMHPQAHSFVPLGSTSDLLRSSPRQTSPIWREMAMRNKVLLEYADFANWSARRWSYSLGDLVEGMGVISYRLPDDVLGRFYWLHAGSIAELHGISLADVLLVYSVRYQWNIIVEEGGPPLELSAGGSPVNEVYFHQLPLMANGKVPSPFGYWSLDPDPVPGPWPEISLPGVRLTRRIDMWSCFLTKLGAEWVTCFHHELKAGKATEGATRFEEVL